MTKPIDNDPNYETAVAVNSNTDYTDAAELSGKVKSMMLVSENHAANVRKGKLRICEVCGKEGEYHVIINHIESNHITGIALPCNICGKKSSSRNALGTHKIRFHK